MTSPPANLHAELEERLRFETLIARDNVLTPEEGPDWQLRAQIQFLFPR